ncbi:CPBP family intramembrane glutamic endopeptidase [Roseimarinus sediminis]|uniref:CPBP family intramembrane glutamic endopeptidase n=1 Tax=Roseimarinus sediminis TaxID=1610899 RepID=UPI003D19B953
MKYQTLQPDLSWKTGDFQSFFIILIAIAFFTVYWFIFKSEKVKNYFYRKYDHDKASARHILFTKYAGFVLMGIFPTVAALIFLDNYTLAKLGLHFLPETAFTSLVWIVGISALIIPVSMQSAKKPKNLANYPQIRSKVWTRRLVIANALAWAFYLFGYELLFRGVLFFPLVDTLGFWPATAVNIALYSATHIPKGLEETIGAAILGLALCWLTALTGTLWIAFFVHLAMAWSNSFTALKHHSDMVLKK